MNFFLIISLSKEISKIDLIGLVTGHIIFGIALTQLIDWSWLTSMQNESNEK